MNKSLIFNLPYKIETHQLISCEYSTRNSEFFYLIYPYYIATAGDIYWMSKKIHCDRLKTANTLKAYLLREKNPRKEKIVCTTTTVVQNVLKMFLTGILTYFSQYWDTFFGSSIQRAQSSTSFKGRSQVFVLLFFPFFNKFAAF